MLTTIPPTLLLLLQPAAWPPSCPSTSHSHLPPALPGHKLHSLHFTAWTASSFQPPAHTHDLKPIRRLCASLSLTRWLGKLNLLPDGNADAPHLPSYICPLCVYYATRWAFLCMYPSCFKHRQTPTQLLTTFPTLRGMPSTENRMTNRMGQEKHKDMP